MRNFFVVFLMSVILVGCQSTKTSFPFDKIDNSFELTPFEIPEEWDVLFIGYQMKAENEHETDYQKQVFTDQPKEVQLYFGKASEENEINMDEILLYQEKMGNRGSKTVYQVSKDQHFVELWIHAEDPDLLERRLEQIHRNDKNRSIFEYGKFIEVNGKKVYYSGRDGNPPEKYYWASTNNKFMFFLWFYESDLSEEERQLENVVPYLEKLTKER
jgi:hypothetical protein